MNQKKINKGKYYMIFSIEDNSETSILSEDINDIILEMQHLNSKEKYVCYDYDDEESIIEFICNDCGFIILYETHRCPICNCNKIVKI